MGSPDTAKLASQIEAIVSKAVTGAENDFIGKAPGDAGGGGHYPAARTGAEAVGLAAAGIAEYTKMRRTISCRICR